MLTRDILNYINTISPLATAESYDNVGLLVGSPNDHVSGICCCLDITNEVVDEAVAKGASLIIAHHPVIFDPLKSVPAWSPVYRMIKHGIAAICIHTNFDMSEGGVNDTLLELLGFTQTEVLEVVNPNGLGFGAVCDLPLCFTSKALAEHCKKSLDLDYVRVSRNDGEIRRAAVCCGSGINSHVMQLAREKGCDAIISGDIKHNFWVEAINSGITLVDAGHYGTEKAFAHRVAALVSRAFADVPVFSADCDVDPCRYV
ncbi:MAG: Nif3-like dinuclear metal center hexameric protein [Oscillospiraceae bacterium]